MKKTKALCLNFDEKLVDEITVFANKYEITKTKLIELAIRSYLDVLDSKNIKSLYIELDTNAPKSIAESKTMPVENYITLTSKEPFDVALCKIDRETIYLYEASYGKEQPDLAPSATPKLEYSRDGKVWIPLVDDVRARSSKTGKFYLRGKDNKIIQRKLRFFYTDQEDIFSPLVACEGNIMTLLDWEHPEQAEMGPYCFAYLFCATRLETAPSLPATKLSEGCYYRTFQGTNLKTAPALPATILADSCYFGMFKGSSLTEMPELPATTLKPSCYKKMFSENTRLEKPLDIFPATTLAEFCYAYMFNKSGVLISPELPAKDLPKGCYEGFFAQSKLTKAPALPLSASSKNCYDIFNQTCLPEDMWTKFNEPSIQKNSMDVDPFSLPY